MRPTGSRRAARKDDNDKPLANRAEKKHGMRPTGSRRAARKDDNDKPLAGRAEKKHNWLIVHMAPGQGFDWLALLPCGCKEIIEIKNPLQPPSARKLTNQELSLFEECVSRKIAYRIIETEVQLDRIAVSHAGRNFC